MKKDAFFVVGPFQLLMALLIVQINKISKEEALLYIGGDFENSTNEEELEKYFCIQKDIQEEYRDVYIFTAVFPKKEVFQNIKAEKKIWAFEGITAYYAEYYASRFETWKISEFDEILAPKPELAERTELVRYRDLKCTEYLQKKENLEKFIGSLNLIFSFDKNCMEIERKHTNFLFDMNFQRFKPEIFLNNAHRLLTLFCASLFENQLFVKLHPHETVEYKYEQFQIDVIKGVFPNEIIYANLLLEDKDKAEKNRVCFMYQSTAAINYYVLFGRENYTIICLGDLLNRYGIGQEDTFVSFAHTKNVLHNLEKNSNVKVYYPSTIEDLYHICNRITGKTDDEGKKNLRYTIDDILWNQVEQKECENEREKILRLREFRLQLEMALLAVQKEKGTYYFNADNACSAMSRKILKVILPTFYETDDIEKSDLIIDCCYSVDYSGDLVDVTKMNIIEGYSELSREEMKLFHKLNNIENIYIWGATETNLKTFQVLEKLGMKDKVRFVFDSKLSGLCQGVRVINFSPDRIKENHIIYICARMAYNEIAEILEKHGYVEEQDFCLGLGIRRIQ